MLYNFVSVRCSSVCKLSKNARKWIVLYPCNVIGSLQITFHKKVDFLNFFNVPSKIKMPFENLCSIIVLHNKKQRNAANWKP